MRSIICPATFLASLVAFALLPVPALAAELTPSTLQAPAWRVAGDTPAWSAEAGWLLPTGAQVIRRFEPREVQAGIVVTVELQPVFSASPRECSTLALGTVALVFHRGGPDAQITVTNADKIVEALPASVEIGTDGKPARPLVARLVYRPAHGEILAEAAGVSLSIPFAPVDGLPVEFVLSTGAPSGLQVASLSVTTGSSDLATVLPGSAAAGADNPVLTQNTGLAAKNLSLNDRDTQGDGRAATAKVRSEPSELSAPPPAEVPSWMPDKVATDQRLIWTAAQQAAAGECAEAWKTISETPAQSLSAARIGFRARSVAGFLRNMGRLAEAERFARIALASTRLAPKQANAGAEHGEARYWRASLAADILHDPEEALRLSQADEGEPDDPRMAPLRARLRRRAETEHAK